MNSSELLVQCLENEGVQYVFGIPGEENIHFLEALRKSSIRFITTADERGAAFMAAGYGRLTGKPGVVATTIGPGALNILNGLGYAQLCGIPLIALTWQNGLIQNSKSNNYQYVDIMNVFKPVTKWQKSVVTGNEIPVAVRSAFKISTQPKYGAVHIEVPADIGREEVSENVVPIVSSLQAKLLPDMANVDLIIRYLRKAKRPLVIAGVRTAEDRISTQLREFINKHRIYTITTPMAQGVVSSESDYSLGSFNEQQRGVVHEVLDQADVVLTIGVDPLEYNPKLWSSQNIIHISIDSVSINICDGFNPQLEVVGDINDILGLIVDRMQKPIKFDNEAFRRLRKTLFKGDSLENSFPVSPEFLVNALKNANEDALFVHDNGMHKLWMTRYFHPNSPNQVIIDNGLATMGSGLPQAIVAKLIHPEKKVVANIGDGGFLMSMGELSTLASLKFPITIVIWRDNGYGMIKWHQEKHGLEPYGVTVHNPDYIKLAESFGGHGIKINSSSELVPALKKAEKENTFTLIDCPVDYSMNLEVFPAKEKDEEYESTTIAA